MESFESGEKTSIEELRKKSEARDAQVAKVTPLMIACLVSFYVNEAVFSSFSMDLEVARNILRVTIFLLLLWTIQIVYFPIRSLRYARARYLVALYKRTGNPFDLEEFVEKRLESSWASSIINETWLDWIPVARTLAEEKLLPPPLVTKRFSWLDRNWLNLVWLPMRLERRRLRKEQSFRTEPGNG